MSKDCFRHRDVESEEFPWPLYRELFRKLDFLDMLKGAGEEPHEIYSRVSETGELLSKTFFCWLHLRGVSGSTEVLAEMSHRFLEFVYLEVEGRNSILAKVKKSHFVTFLNLCEFAVPEEQWRSGINPFDGLRLLFEFLEEIHYPVKRQAIERTLSKLRHTLVKQPVHQSIANGIAKYSM